MKVYELMEKIYAEEQQNHITWDDIDRDTQDKFVDCWVSENRKKSIELLEESIVDDPYIVELLIDFFNHAQGSDFRVLDNINLHLRTTPHMPSNFAYEYRNYTQGLDQG